jgi:UDPglucose 6-dehydrogenase
MTTNPELALNESALSLVGLGKLGCCLAACFADKGFDVIGVDVEEKVIRTINEGRAPFAEPELDEVLARVGGKKLRATLAHKEAIEGSDVTFILTATPSNSDGSFSNRYVETAAISLATALYSSKKQYHVFVISSTVIPGSIENSFIPLIEKYSDRKLNEGFGLCYDPDWVALGSVIHDFRNPDFVLVGESNPRDGEMLARMHHRMCDNNPPVSRMSLISGEIAKVSLNAYITMKISFANTLANLCENIPGADVDAITSTIGRDRRISPHYFKGGLAFGGNCFPRDTRAFRAFAKAQGNPAEIISACDRVNDFQDQHLVAKTLQVLGTLDGPKTVGILGLAFKPKTFVITESPAIKLIRELIKHNVHVVAYDPLATDNAKILFGDQVQYVSSAEQCMNLSNLWLVTQPAKEFKTAIETAQPDRPVTVLDCWRILDATKLSSLVKCVPMGRALPQPETLPAV